MTLRCDKDSGFGLRDQLHSVQKLQPTLKARFFIQFRVGVGGPNVQRQQSSGPNAALPGGVNYAPDPEFSEEARKAKYQGTMVLWMIVGPDGRTHDIRVQRSLGMGLDQKAIEAVRQWRFEPGRRDGIAVAVQINVEVNFRLY